MSTVVSQITRLTIVYSTIYSGADQRKLQSSASLAFVRATGEFPAQMASDAERVPFDDVIIWCMLVAWKSRDIIIPAVSPFVAPKFVITVTSECVRWRLKPPASRLFAQPFVQAQIKENIKTPRHWPLLVESTGDTGPVTRKCIWWRHHCFTETYGATNDDEASTITTHCFQWEFRSY